MTVSHMLGSVSLASLLLAANPALAQGGQTTPASTAGAAQATTSDPAPVAQTSAHEPIDGDIIVTANKRDETASKVGASITAFSGQTLQNRKIESAVELARNVPGLALVPSTHGTPVFTLRGVGYNSDSLGVYPAVSISLDQAPMPFPVLAAHSFYDLERIEILKGPQGTLFGQNSTGGAINYIAAKPTKDLQTGFSLDYGRFNEVKGTAYISGPLSDTIGIRLAIDAAHRDDWQYNYVRKDSIGEQNYVAGRLLIDWQASDKLKLELNVNGSIDRSDPQALQAIASIPSVPSAPSFQELNTVLAPNDLRAANWSVVAASPTPQRSPTTPALPRGNRKLAQAILRADVDLSDSISLTSISTYNHFNQKLSLDLDGSQYETIGGPTDDGTISDFSQELRLSNAASGQRFRWTVGANYNHSDIHEYQVITYGENSLSNAGTNFIHITGVDNRGRINTYAAFANSEFGISDRLTFKAAARYTKSVNRNSQCDLDPAADQNLSSLFTLLGQLIGGQTIPLGPDKCYPLNAQSLPINAQGVAGGPVNATLSEDNVSWKAGLDFNATSRTLFYVNVARGYKAGSFPVITASIQDQLTPAKQESVTAYEAGFKTRLADNKIQWSGAVFYQDYRNKQVQGSALTPLFGLLQRLDNIPKSRTFGAETDVVVRPVVGLTLSGSASFLDTKVLKYTATNVFGGQTDFAGNRLPFAPKWSLVGDIDYQIPTAAGGNVFIGTSVNYRTYVDAYVGGSILTIPDNGVNRWTTRYPFHIDGYALVDARIGYELPGKRVAISAWGKNIFNTFNVQNVISYNDVITRATGMPVSYGLTVKVRWN